MTLLVSVFAAVISTVIWYKSPSRSELKLGVLCWLFWGASLMWLVDAIFELYAKKAEEAGIPFKAEACLDAPVRVSNADLSSLLGNLLTNAFDASGRVDQPEVEARVLPAKDYLCVYVRNRADARLLKANPLLHTTKQNPELHGIGLQVVRQIAQRYHGWVDISAEGDWFTVQVMLLMEET